MGKLRRQDFAAWLTKQVGKPYLWGGNGESLSDIIRLYAIRTGQTDNATKNMLAQMSKNGFKDTNFYDCSGLGVCYLTENKAISSDMTSSMLYKNCAVIDRSKVVTGDMCFLMSANGIHHVGYVVDDNCVVHAFNQSVGVIHEPISARRDWIFRRPSAWFDYSDADMAIAKGDVVYLDSMIDGYNTAECAAMRIKKTSTYAPGTYYVYKVYGKAVNITRNPGTPGAWVMF